MEAAHRFRPFDPSGVAVISSLDIERARAVPIAALVAQEIPLRHDGFGLCPFHDERSPSFHVNAKGNYFKCFGCGAHGNPIDWVRLRRGLDFPSAVRELLGLSDDQSGVSSQLARPTRNPLPPAGHFFDREDDLARANRARAIWRGAKPIAETSAAWLYLHQRGISKSIPASLRSHPALSCSEAGQKLPALVAAFQAPSRDVVAIQRIWLSRSVTFDGGERPNLDNRAPLRARKKTLGRLGDAAVRLAPAGRVLGLAEGVETGLAAMRLFRLPVWVVGGLSRLGYPAHDGRPERVPSIWLPPEVEELVIFGDNGEIGHRVADFASDWWSRRGLRAEAVYPRERFSDFNDQLMAAT